MIIFNQSECIISVWHSYTTLKIVNKNILKIWLWCFFKYWAAVFRQVARTLGVSRSDDDQISLLWAGTRTRTKLTKKSDLKGTLKRDLGVRTVPQPPPHFKTSGYDERANFDETPKGINFPKGWIFLPGFVKDAFRLKGRRTERREYRKYRDRRKKIDTWSREHSP